jgi:hypothetical protein
MAFVITFTPPGMTSEQYYKVINRLKGVGAGSPKGRQYHVCYGYPGNLQVTDVWDSMETFDEFGKTLMPILQETGIDPRQPNVQPLHNIID